MCNTPTGNCAKSLRKTSPLKISKERLKKSVRKRIIFGENSQGDSDQGQILICESMCVSYTIYLFIYLTLPTKMQHFTVNLRKHIMYLTMAGCTLQFSPITAAPRTMLILYMREQKSKT